MPPGTIGGWLRGWWRQGERPGDSVFRQSWRSVIVVVAVTGPLIYLIPALHDSVSYTVFVLILARASFERRRAVIIGPDRLGSRGPFGAAKFVRLDELVGAEATNVLGSFLLIPRAVKGVRVRLRSGTVFCIALDLPQRQRIFALISAAALPPTGGGSAAGPTPR